MNPFEEIELEEYYNEELLEFYKECNEEAPEVVKQVLGKTFKGKSNQGIIVEKDYGLIANPFPTADLGYWELKTKRIGSVSAITLGGKNTGTMQDLFNQVYSKCINVVLIEYIQEPETFTVVKVTLLWNLNRINFDNAYGKIIKLEQRTDGQRTLKCYKKHFIKLYEQNKLEFTI